MARKTILKQILEPLIVVAAALYFVIDALVLSILKPLLKRLGRLRLLQLVASWIASLGPYPTLALFVIPLAVLEPVKPVGGYLIATGHVVNGILLLTAGEVLKIVIVERIFHIGRDKLMTIPAFAWAYTFVSGWLTWLQQLPPWQAVKRRFADVARWVRRLKPRRRVRSFL